MARYRRHRDELVVITQILHFGSVPGTASSVRSTEISCCPICVQNIDYVCLGERTYVHTYVGYAVLRCTYHIHTPYFVIRKKKSGSCFSGEILNMV